MSKHKSFPKEGLRKEKETIRDLRAKLLQAFKEIRFLKDELNNLVKPQRERKAHTEVKTLSEDAWRKSFLKRYRREVLGKED